MEPSQGMTRYSIKIILEVILRRWIWLAVCAVIFAIGISAYYWLQYFSTYQVSATFIPAVQATNPDETSTGSYSVIMSQSFIKHEEVLDAIVRSVSFDVSNDALGRAISSDVNESGMAVTVHVEWNNEQQALEVLSALKANLSFAITHSAKAGTIKWLESAPPSAKKLEVSRMQIYMIFLLGALAGAAVGAVISFLIGSLDKRIFNLKQVKYNGDVRVIGFAGRKSDLQEQKDSYHQQITAIAMYLKMMMDIQDQRLIMCVSPTDQCGTGVIVQDIAQVLAGLQLKVLIVTIQGDASRHFIQTESVIVPLSPNVDRCVFVWDDKECNPDFDGPISGTLASSTKKYAMVLVDCPPLLTNIPMSGFVAGMDTILLICGCGVTKQADLDAAVSLLSRAEAQPIYCVWNFVDRQYDNTFLPVETVQEQRKASDEPKNISTDVNI